MSKPYRVLSTTTAAFTWTRFRDDGLRWAVRCLWQDIQHVRRGGTLFDHRLPRGFR